MKMKVKLPFKLPNLISFSSKKMSAPPGTLEFTGSQTDHPVKITLMDYDSDDFQEKEIANIDEYFNLAETKTVSWINIDGLNDISLIEKIETGYDIHPLTMEDVLNVTQRAKYEDSGDYIFVVMRMLTFDDNTSDIASEQVSFILSKNCVFSFQEHTGDVFDSVRERIRTGKGRIRKSSCDYLLYALVDAIVDNYFVVLEKMAEKIETLEESLMRDPDDNDLRKLHVLRREMIYIRKSIWPLRELLNSLTGGESTLIAKETVRYFHDVYDHSIQVIDTVESFRDVVSGLMDMYLSVVSNKMNSVMKVLTIIATIFIPLTFIAGIYGMNFEYMPELKWKWGYFGVWGVMLLVLLAMLLYFKRKKWL